MPFQHMYDTKVLVVNLFGKNNQDSLISIVLIALVATKDKCTDFG